MARLGSEARPALGHVRTVEDAIEVTELCEALGYKVIIGVEPDVVPDLQEIERLVGPEYNLPRDPSVGRNDPCPCGSGKKYKYCCGP